MQHEQVLAALITINVTTMDRYLPSLYAVIEGGDPDSAATTAG